MIFTDFITAEEFSKSVFRQYGLGNKKKLVRLVWKIDACKRHIVDYPVFFVFWFSFKQVYLLTIQPKVLFKPNLI